MDVQATTTLMIYPTFLLHIKVEMVCSLLPSIINDRENLQKSASNIQIINKIRHMLGRGSNTDITIC